MIKGDVFDKQYFPSNTFALFINTFLDSKCGIINGYKNSMSMTNTTNQITVSSGAACIKGRFLRENSSTTLSVSYQNNTFCRLVIEIDLDKVNTAAELNQVYYKIIASESNYPTLTQTDIVNNESGIYQYELAKFKANSNGISDFQDTRTFIDYNSIYSHIDDVIDALVAGGVTATQVSYSNTNSGLSSNRVQSAIDEVNTKINEVNTKIDNINVYSQLRTTTSYVSYSLSISENKIGTISISNPGYYPIAISGFSNTNGDGVNVTTIYLSQMNNGSGVITYGVKNMDNANTKSGNIYINVLWIKA